MPTLGNWPLLVAREQALYCGGRVSVDLLRKVEEFRQGPMVEGLLKGDYLRPEVDVRQRPNRAGIEALHAGARSLSFQRFLQ